MEMAETEDELHMKKRETLYDEMPPQIRVSWMGFHGDWWRCCGEGLHWNCQHFAGETVREIKSGWAQIGPFAVWWSNGEERTTYEYEAE